MDTERTLVGSARAQLSDRDIERRKSFVGLTKADLARIEVIRDLLAAHADELAQVFFKYLAGFDEAKPLFNSRRTLEEAQRLKREHLIAMGAGSYGRDYIEQRVKLGLLYSSAGLDVQVFLGAFHNLMRAVGVLVMSDSERDPQAGFERFMSFKKVAFLDLGIIVDVLMSERERTIALQQAAIRELSTPVLQVRDRLLILPIIGVLDSQRAKQLTDSLLQSIRTNRAKVVVMDVTGVAAVDSKVANHLLQTIAAARLMGALVIVTGLTAEVAQALVALGVDLTKVNTVGDLQGGLEEAERMLGHLRESQMGEAAASEAA